MPPLIGITTDIVDPGQGKPLKADCSMNYARCIAAAGGTPILLPPLVEQIPEQLRLCHGFVFSGGDDPRTEAFGVPTHPAATPLHPARQRYELALLAALKAEQPATPVLGVCLGMQLMALLEGGRLNQHLPETLRTAADHRGRHTIRPEPGHAAAMPLREGSVWSNHHQSVEDPGRLAVLANAPDGVIEAIAGTDRPFYCGVQWHPERTDDPGLGQGLFTSLVNAAKRPA